MHDITQDSRSDNRQKLPVKKVAAVQSSYIPWKGYFDIIQSVDEFILLDDVQYTVRDWRSRNRIKTRTGPQWLTIPVIHGGRRDQKIFESQIQDDSWRRQHWNALIHNYSQAPFFKEYRGRFEALYLGDDQKSLSQVNMAFIRQVCDILGITTRLTWSMDYPCKGSKTDRLLELCRSVHAGEYLTGPSARNYFDENLFRDSGIGVKYMSYEGYKEYRQLFPPFEHQVTILDLIFNEGPNAREFMLSFSGPSREQTA